MQRGQMAFLQARLANSGLFEVAWPDNFGSSLFSLSGLFPAYYSTTCPDK
jgi:hypothetical protein